MFAGNKMSYPAGRFLPIRLVISFDWGGVVKKFLRGCRFFSEGRFQGTGDGMSEGRRKKAEGG